MDDKTTETIKRLEEERDAHLDAAIKLDGAVAVLKGMATEPIQIIRNHRPMRGTYRRLNMGLNAAVTKIVREQGVISASELFERLRPDFPHLTLTKLVSGTWDYPRTHPEAFTIEKGSRPRDHIYRAVTARDE